MRLPQAELSEVRRVSYTQDAELPAPIPETFEVLEAPAPDQRSLLQLEQMALAANTVTWAKEFASFGIRVGAVAPGMIETPMTQGMNQKARDALVAAIPVGRIGVPEDIWVAVKFVLECDYFNARCIDVDGGLSM